MPDRLLLS